MFLIVPLNCLATSWNGLYEEFKDILDEGIVCKYEYNGEGDSLLNIDTITFKADADGICVSHNDESCEILINNEKEIELFEWGDYYTQIAYNMFDYETFFDTYKTTGTCVNQINIYASNYYTVAVNCPDNYGPSCYKYTINKTNGNNTSSNNNGNTNNNTKCHIESAEFCKTYKNTDGGKVRYIEIGYERLVDETFGNYFMISDDNKFSTGVVARESTGLTLKFQNDSYTIMNKDNIFLGITNSPMFTDNIELRKKSGGSSDVYYIYSANDTDDSIIGDFDNDTTEYDPNVPEDVEGDNVEIPSLDVEEIVFCERNETRKTFQIIGYILFIAKIVVPLLLIILGSIDFAKAVISNSDKAPQEALRAFGVRIAIAVIIFLIPTILSFLIGLIDGASEAFEDTAFSDCSDCLLDPFGDCKAEDIVK